MNKITQIIICLFLIFTTSQANPRNRFGKQANKKPLTLTQLVTKIFDEKTTDLKSAIKNANKKLIEMQRAFRKKETKIEQKGIILSLILKSAKTVSEKESDADFVEKLQSKKEIKKTFEIFSKGLKDFVNSMFINKVEDIFKDTNIDEENFNKKSKEIEKFYDDYKDLISKQTINTIISIFNEKIEKGKAPFKNKWENVFKDTAGKTTLESLIKDLKEKQEQHKKEEQKRLEEIKKKKAIEERKKEEEKIKKDFEKKVTNFIGGIQEYLTDAETRLALIAIIKTKKYYLVKDLIAKSTDDKWKQALNAKNIVIDINAKDTDKKTALHVGIEGVDLNDRDGFKSIYYLIMGKLPEPPKEEEKKVREKTPVAGQTSMPFQTSDEPVKVMFSLEAITTGIKLKKTEVIQIKKKRTLERAEYFVDTQTDPDKQINELKKTIDEDKTLDDEQKDLLKKLIDIEKTTDVIEKKEQIKKAFSGLASKPETTTDLIATVAANQKAQTPGYKKTNLEKIKEDLSHYFTLIHDDVINKLIKDLEAQIKEKEEGKEERDDNDDDWE